MNHKDIADRIVTLGVGEHNITASGPLFAYHPNPLQSENCSAEWFVHDWRVAGAMMERCEMTSIIKGRDGKWQVGASTHNSRSMSEGENESPPLAINLACLEALSNE